MDFLTSNSLDNVLPILGQSLLGHLDTFDSILEEQVFSHPLVRSTVSDSNPKRAARLYGPLGFLWIGIALTVWLWDNYQEKIDFFAFLYHVIVWSPVTIWYFIDLFLDTSLTRRIYWYAAVLSVAAPFFLNVFLVGYFGYDFATSEREKYTVSYEAIKMILAVIYSLGTILEAYLLFFPIREYWLSKQDLFDVEPYDRPTAEWIAEQDDPTNVSLYSDFAGF